MTVSRTYPEHRPRRKIFELSVVRYNNAFWMKAVDEEFPN